MPDPPDENTKFERMSKEPPLAWMAFRMYRDMGSDRTMERVRESLGKGPGYLRALERWSHRWRWGQRCLKQDDWLDRKAREAAEARLPLWEQRRQESLERNLEVAAQLRDYLREMMAHPITRETTREVGGREVTVVEPARWNWTTIIAGFKMVAELEAATIAEGMLEADDDFDVETATAEQLKAFCRKHRRGRGGPVSGPLG
jgi:hypothetical protein